MRADGTAIRPMQPADAPAVHVLAMRAFDDLNARGGRPPDPRPPLESAYARIHRLIGTDPGGACVAERDGAVTGAALALLREGLWGLSLLVVDPGEQSGGSGAGCWRRPWPTERGPGAA